MSRASLITQLVNNLSAMQEPQFNSWVRKICWRRDRLPISVFLGLHCGSAGKESACNAGDIAWIPGLGRPPRERKIYRLQCSGLENAMDSIVLGVAELGTTESLTSPYHRLEGNSDLCFALLLSASPRGLSFTACSKEVTVSFLLDFIHFLCFPPPLTCASSDHFSYKLHTTLSQDLFLEMSRVKVVKSFLYYIV